VKRVLTDEAVDHILSVWADVGPAAARKLAPGYGITELYVGKLASRRGVKCKRPKPKKRRGPDPRWQWAIERGRVVI
jgi:hypothetical protein